MDYWIGKAESVPESVSDFLMYLNLTITNLTSIYEAAEVDWQNLNEKDVLKSLNIYWDRRDVVAETTIIPTRMRQIESELALFDLRYESSLQSMDSIAKELQAAIEVLAKPTKPDVPEEIFEWSKLFTKLTQYVVDGVSIDDYASRLIEGCHHPFSLIRRDSVSVLGHCSSPKSIETLLDCSEDEESAVRAAAVRSITLIGSKNQNGDVRIVDALIHALSDENEDVCSTAIEGLRRIKSQRAVYPLIACLDRDFRKDAYIGWVGSALAEIPDQRALQPLIRKLNEVMSNSSITKDLRLYPVSGLYKAIQAIGGPEADEALKRYFG